MKNSTAHWITLSAIATVWIVIGIFIGYSINKAQAKYNEEQFRAAVKSEFINGFSWALEQGIISIDMNAVNKVDQQHRDEFIRLLNPNSGTKPSVSPSVSEKQIPLKSI